LRPGLSRAGCALRARKDFDHGDQPVEPYDPYGPGPAQAAPDVPNAVRMDDRTPFAKPVGG